MLLFFDSRNYGSVSWYELDPRYGDDVSSEADIPEEHIEYAGPQKTGRLGELQAFQILAKVDF